MNGIRLEDSKLEWLSNLNAARKHDHVGNGLSAKEIQTGKDWSLEQWRDHYRVRLKSSQLVGERAQLHLQLLAIEKQLRRNEVGKSKQRKSKNQYAMQKHTYDRTKLGENFKQNSRRPPNDPSVIAERKEKEKANSKYWGWKREYYAQKSGKESLKEMANQKVAEGVEITTKQMNKLLKQRIINH
jgi:hypothetical protein